MKYKDIVLFARELRKNQTTAEIFFWQKVRRKRFCQLRFQRQYVIEHSEIHGEKSFFIPDFYCHRHKLIIEIDGGIHKNQKEKDMMRTNILKEMGYRVIRFSNEEVLNNWYNVEAKLKNAIFENLVV